MKAIYLLLLLSLFAQPKPTKVYICNSKLAYAYHAKKNCDYLQNCSQEIKLLSLTDAKKLGKNKQCKWCYKK